MQEGKFADEPDKAARHIVLPLVEPSPSVSLYGLAFGFAAFSAIAVRGMMVSPDGPGCK